ncbi:MAG TPA: DUF3298 and DUF4163 domain-containing protein [Clostridiaceae bacterium]|nr:DUF3298 and DUF4163 domain-containing protein [Clostridiaceae bacterium]
MDIIQNPVYIVTQRMVSPNGEMVVDYPVIVSMPNQAVQYRINRAILNLVNKLHNEQIRRLIEQGYKDISRLSVQGWYEIKTNERGVLSLSIGNYTFAYPSAHGLTIIKSLTFDVNTGKIYELKDLFKPGSDYVKKLSAAVNEQIKQREIPLLSPFKGIKPDQDYYIADKVLVLYFQLYELAPYSYGFPQFPISVYSISDIITEDGPLGRMMANI